MMLSSAIALSACGSGDSRPPDSGVADGGGDSGIGELLTIGAACASDDECGGTANPRCLAGIYPLEDDPVLSAFGLTFVGGYCSDLPSCSSDDQCDPANGGRCYQPFANSTAEEWAEVESALSLDLSSLATYGVCLKTCTTSSDCRSPGYTCEQPLGALIDILSETVTVANDRLFCVQPTACITTDCGTGGICDVQDDGVTATCVCSNGFELVTDDDGANPVCVAACEPGCAANSSCIVDTANGGVHVCECDAGFVDDGAGGCAPVCDPVCGANASCVVDAANGDAHVCECNTGFMSDGAGGCLPSCGAGCAANSTCQLAENVQVCVCDAGYEFDGTACIAVACESDGCDVNATLAQAGGTGALRCVCNAGYFGDGASCAAVDASACDGGCGTDAACETDTSDRQSVSCTCPVERLMQADGNCAAAGTHRYVAADAPNAMDNGDCSVEGTPCESITYAVTQASDGDIVHVATGTYPELVVVTKPLVFLGANAGVNAGVGASSRGAESTVIGFRSPDSGGHPTVAHAFSVTIDGFTITPQDDMQVLSWATYNQVSLYGGPLVRVANNVFDGGTWNIDCDDADDPNDANSRVLLCKDMADSALMIQSGRFEIVGNSFTDYRRPVDIAAWGATVGDPVVPPHGVFSRNALTRFSIRGVWLLEHLGGDVVLEGNDFDGADFGITAGAAAIINTSGHNVFRGNSIHGFASGVFTQACDGSNTAGATNTYVGNRFVGNRSAIQYYAAGSACAVVANVHGNHFSGSTAYAVRWNGNFTSVDPPATIDATGNWFGDALGAELLGYLYVAGDDTSATRENVTPFVTVSGAYTTPGGCFTLP
ncbi:MAG: DUF1565 domain-containing protein [Sandaracinaceae bacterium]|nr:DUF1565 domain-containing protein [Sandaracinaceae bacterium]